MKRMNDEWKTLSSKEVCRILQISTPTLYKMIESGELDAVKDERGSWRVSLLSLQELQGFDQNGAFGKNGDAVQRDPIVLYTLDQCQEILQLGRSSVLKLLYSGELHGIKVKGMWRVPRKEMERYLQERM